MKLIKNASVLNVFEYFEYKYIDYFLNLDIYC